MENAEGYYVEQKALGVGAARFKQGLGFGGGGCASPAFHQCAGLTRALPRRVVVSACALQLYSRCTESSRPPFLTSWRCMGRQISSACAHAQLSVPPLGWRTRLDQADSTCVSKAFRFT